eukprot:jgi/Chrzof1/11687/Cz06g05130.t1
MKFFQFKGSDSAQNLPADRIQRKDLASGTACLQSQSGIPYTADCCAYEPIQRLLAVSTSDGRIKIIGKEGVERNMKTAARMPEATRQLKFLYNRGIIVRVDQAGRVEIWSIDHTDAHDDSQPLHSLHLDDDDVTCVAAMKREPYLMLGCSSGTIRVAGLVNASGSTVTEARQVRALKMMAYTIHPDKLDASGEVTHIATESEGRTHRMLCLHSQSGAAIWDVSAQELIAVMGHKNSKTAHSARQSGAVAAACWIPDSSKGDFATGHAGGDVNVWALPAADELQPRLLSQLRVSAAPSRGICALEYVGGKGESLLVFGGGHEDHPDGLMLLPLPEALLELSSDDGLDEKRAPAAPGPKPAPKKLPWFGAICSYNMVPASGAITGYEEPAAILVLMEGGELVVHDLAADKAVSRAPQHFMQRFQSQPSVTAARLRIIPTGRVPLQGLQGACMTSLRDWSSTNKAAPTASDATSHSPWRWIVDGGRPSKPDTRPAYGVVYCTGHQDGCVQLWDMYTHVPMLLGAVPSTAASKALGSRAAARPVSTLEFAWEQGLLISGHEGGEVRVYQFNERAKHIDCIQFESVGSRSNNEGIGIDEPPGFQLRLLTLIHTADICNSAYAPTFKMVAISDKAGSVSLIDLSKPAVMWFQAPMQHPVVSLALAQCPLPSHKERSEFMSAYHDLATGSHIKTVVAVAQDSCLAVLDAANGFALSREPVLRPKNPSTALYVELLDSDGAPLWFCRDVASLVRVVRSRSLSIDRGSDHHKNRHSTGTANARNAPAHASGTQSVSTSVGGPMSSSGYTTRTQATSSSAIRDRAAANIAATRVSSHTAASSRSPDTRWPSRTTPGPVAEGMVQQQYEQPIRSNTGITAHNAAPQPHNALYRTQEDAGCSGGNVSLNGAHIADVSSNTCVMQQAGYESAVTARCTSTCTTVPAGPVAEGLLRDASTTKPRHLSPAMQREGSSGGISNTSAASAAKTRAAAGGLGLRGGVTDRSAGSSALSSERVTSNSVGGDDDDGHDDGNGSAADSDVDGRVGASGGKDDGDDDELDVDALLAQAAAQVEAQDKARKSVVPRLHGKSTKQQKPTHSRSNSASPEPRSHHHAVAGDGSSSATATTSGTTTYSTDRLPLPATKSATAAYRSTDSPERSGSGALADEGMPDRTSPSKSRLQSQSQQQQQQQQHQRSAFAAASAASESEMPGAPISLQETEAAYALVATNEYLRLYSIQHAVSADRTTMKRVPLSGALQFASAFAANGAPALACILDVGGEPHLQVFSLPSLELMTDTTLSAAVGWQWLWDARAESRLEHVCACTRHGHLALLGKGSELVMLSLSVGTDMPQAAEYIYDWDLAAAAHAAGLAFEQARVLSGSSNMNTSNRLQRHSGSNTDLGGKVTKGLNNQDQGGGDAASVTALAASSSDGGTTAGAGSSGGRPKDFLGFMSKIGQDLNKAGEGVAKGFQKAIDETQKGLQKVAQVFEEDIPNLLVPKAGKGEGATRPPDLALIFSGTMAGGNSSRSLTSTAVAGGAAAGHRKAGTAGALPPPSTAAATATFSSLNNAPLRSPSKGTLGLGGMLHSNARGAMGVGHSNAGMQEPIDEARAELLGMATAGGSAGSSAGSRPAATATRTASGAVGSSKSVSGRSSSVASTLTSAPSARVRTADEIRQAYGRSAQKGANDARNVMEENRQKLAERGEKLSQLQDKTADLEESAAGFAEMAKMLAERERSKAKWFG